MKNRHILVSASTFPAFEGDEVPAFVRDQITAMKQVEPSLRFSVLAPHDARSRTKSFMRHENYGEYRFHYMWPYSLEKLAGRGGIMPALKANPLNYLLIPFLFLGEFIALYRLSRKIKPDVLYAHWFTPQGVTNAWVSRLMNIPFVFTTHAADVDVWHKIPFVGQRIVRIHARQARAITAVSRRSLAKLERFFSAKQWSELQACTAIIPMGVHMELPQQEVVPRTGKTNLFFMGRLAEKKGVTYLLQAVEQLQDASIRLTIAGDGPLRRTLEQEVKDRGIDNQVTFAGYVSGKQKQQLLADATIVVLPSIITDLGDAEGLPVVFMEALACGKICIATNESGADDFLQDEKNGFLISQKDPVALAQAISQARALTPEQMAAMQTLARETAEQFSWPTVARQHIDFFESKLN